MQVKSLHVIAVEQSILACICIRCTDVYFIEPKQTHRMVGVAVDNATCVWKLRCLDAYTASVIGERPEED